MPPARATAATAPEEQVREAMAQPVTALQALAGVKPSVLPRAFPVAAAALGSARDQASAMIAAQQVRLPEAPAAMLIPTAPAPPTPGPPKTAPRDPRRHAPIEHSEVAGRTPDGASSPDRVSAGPRPRVALGGPSDPVAADARHHATQGALTSRLGVADLAARRDFAIERLPAPVVEAAPRPPPALGDAMAVATAAPRTARPSGRPAADDARLEAMLAPKLAERIQGAAAGAESVAAQSAAAAAAFDAQRRAAAESETTEQVRVRSAAGHRAEGLRGQWQHANDGLHRERSDRIAQTHERAKTTVQSSVQTTERQADQRLTDAEAQGQRVLADAQGRADAMHRNAERPLLDPGGGGSETDPARVLQEAQDLVQQMLDAANAHNLARVEELRQQVADLLAAHATELQSFVEATLAEFPLIAQFYQQQIDELMALVQSDSARIADARNRHNREMMDAWVDRLTHDLGNLKRYFGEIDTISQYDDLDQLREAFGITLNGVAWDEETDDGSSHKEIALLAAISTEHALRRSATGGQMDDFGFGQGFQAVFGQMQLDAMETQAYTHPNVRQDPADGLWYTYDDEGNRRQEQGQGYASEAEATNQGRGPYGAETFGRRIEFYPLAFSAGADNPDDLLFNILHEFGHSFNSSMHGVGYTDLGSETIRATVNGERQPIAGAGVGRLTDEAYGMSPYPYQQNRRGTDGEEFADMFLNWVQGSFADNDAGRARMAWMNQHMWGDTTLRGVAGQELWGWADTSIDRYSGSSRWVDPRTRGGQYRVQIGDTLESIAAALEVDPAVIQEANNMGTSTDVRLFPLLIIPGVSDEQIAERSQ